MLKNLFRKKSLPQEDGGEAPGSGSSRRVKRFDVVLVNLEGSPEYELRHKLVIGREVGDIVIDDVSISPRHATFTLQDEVVSLIDHGSQRGTYINGRKIPVGKFIIVETGDSIKLGDLDLKVQVGSKFVDESEVPETPGPVTSTKIISPPAIPTAKPAPLSSGRRTDSKKKGKKKRNSFSFKSYRSANTLLRVFALLGDFFLAYVILILIRPFDDFKLFLSELPAILQELTPVSVSEVASLLRGEYQIPIDPIIEVFGFINGYLEIYPLVVVYCIVRLLSTLLLGTSFSQFMLGIRAGMHPLWARLGGVLRVLIGFITWPFLIFDLPALFSRRTFKEVITFTHIYNSSKIASFIGIIFYPVLLLAAFIVAPLFEGFEVTEPILLSPKIQERVKAETEDNPAPESLRKASSEFFQVSLTYAPEEFRIVPRFTILGAGAKTKMEPGIAIFEKMNFKTWMTLTQLKSFDLASLIEIALRGNPFFQDRFPALYEYAYTSAASSEAIPRTLDEKKTKQFEGELTELIKLSFGLSIENALEYVQSGTPILSGLVGFRSSLIGLLDGAKFTDAGFIRLGDTVFLKLSGEKNAIDYLLPLRPKGRLFVARFNGENPQTLNGLRNKIYKFALFQSEWGRLKKTPRGETLSALEVIDAFSVDFLENRFNMDLAQALYGYYFEQSGKVLSDEIPEEKQVWTGSLTSVIQILESIDASSTPELNEAREKLLSNFRDLKTAFDGGNKSFFGISTAVSL